MINDWLQLYHYCRIYIVEKKKFKSKKLKGQNTHTTHIHKHLMIIPSINSDMHSRMNRML